MANNKSFRAEKELVPLLLKMEGVIDLQQSAFLHYIIRLPPLFLPLPTLPLRVLLLPLHLFLNLSAWQPHILAPHQFLYALLLRLHSLFHLGQILDG